MTKNDNKNLVAPPPHTRSEKIDRKWIKVVSFLGQDFTVVSKQKSNIENFHGGEKFGVFFSN